MADVTEIIKILEWREDKVIKNFSKMYGEPPTITDGEMYAFWNNKSPILLQAHIDVVKDFMTRRWDKDKNDFVDQTDDMGPKRVDLIRRRNIVRNKNGILGGDDRAGIIAMMFIKEMCETEKMPMPSLLLTNKEETGGQGMKKFIKDVKTLPSDMESVRIIIGLDRRGNGEFVTYVEQDIEVKEYIESFGFVKFFGSYSDSKDLSEHLKIPSVNLSVGYYDPHGKSESLHLDETWLTATRVAGMIADPISKRYVVRTYTYTSTWKGNSDYSGSWVAGKIWDSIKRCYVWPEDSDQAKDQNKKDAKKIYNLAKSIQKRQDKCAAIRKKNVNVPVTCESYPYMDYLLSDDKIIEGFHVVSTPGYSRSLEEWDEVFHSKAPCYTKWNMVFGFAKKLYVKSSSSNLFYLAIKLGQGHPTSATSCEVAERDVNLANTKGGNANVTVVTPPAPITDPEKLLESQKGYCRKFSKGDCDGGCHGDQATCPYTRDGFFTDEDIKQEMEDYYRDNGYLM